MTEVGVPVEGMYEDAKRFLRTIATPIVRPIQVRFRRRRALALFAPNLADHPRSVTDLVDYYNWHEDGKDWISKKGFLISCSFGEIMRFWIQPDHFVPYEARLLRFQRAGGKVERVFLLGADLADPIRLWALQRVLLRHEILGFSPKVRTMLDLREPLGRLGISAGMAASLNGEVAYFLQFPSDSEVLMVRTTDSAIARRTENVLHGFARNADSFSSWYARQVHTLPAEVVKQVEFDVGAVEEVAR
ncbi:MAG TPA: hypothetical protein VF017_06690 [Thermoanaerobaculia bacterium]|nr:hypothetical protein [Thermoanaerobaculia bacterium]